MMEFNSGDQRIRFDRSKTIAPYDAIPAGKRCGCSYRMNFAAQRSSVFPDEFRSLLNNIGIDPVKEGEVYEVGPDGDCRIYGGWFYFAGEIIRAGERTVTLPNFEYWFADCKRLPKPATDFGGRVAVIEFITRVPWVLSDPAEAPTGYRRKWDTALHSGGNRFRLGSFREAYISFPQPKP
jgi:hypothetical protein